MNKYIVFIFTICLFLIHSVSHAETLVGGYPACMSEDHLDQMMQATVKKDERAFDYLINNYYCTITKAGVPVSVLDRTWTGRVKIRAYVGDSAVVLWTVMENVSD